MKLNVGEVLAIVSFSSAIIGFLFKNYMVLQDLNKTVSALNRLMSKISDRQDLNEDRIIKLEEQMKVIFKNLSDVCSRIREIERRNLK